MLFDRASPLDIGSSEAMTLPPLSVGAPIAVERPRRRFLVLRNRHAGLAKARLVAAVAAKIEAAGATVEIAETHSAEEVTALITASEHLDAIVAAGGDGTIRALALAMRAQGLALPLGLIPAGTGNVLAHEIKLTHSPARIATALLTGPVRNAHVATANGTPFLLMCGCGFDARILLRLSVALKQRVGRAAYTSPTLATFLEPAQQPFDVVVDGITHQATWIVVANARSYAGSFTVAPSATLFDARLHAVLFKGRTRFARLQEMLALASGRIDRCATVEIIPCSKVAIEAPPLTPSQLDGDAFGFGPVSIATTSTVVPLILPSGS